MKPIKSLAILLAAFLCLAPAACSRSRIIIVSLTNTSDRPLSGIMVDYPEASFGKNSLQPGEIYQYRIKATDTGPLKITFTNAGGQSRSLPLGTVQKNDEGSIEIKLTQDEAVSGMHLR